MSIITNTGHSKIEYFQFHTTKYSCFLLRVLQGLPIYILFINTLKEGFLLFFFSATSVVEWTEVKRVSTVSSISRLVAGPSARWGPVLRPCTGAAHRWRGLGSSGSGAAQRAGLRSQWGFRAPGWGTAHCHLWETQQLLPWIRSKKPFLIIVCWFSPKHLVLTVRWQETSPWHEC